MDGLFIETPKPMAVGATIKLHFLVPEGEIRTEAVVRYVKPGHGLGLEFTAVRGEDRPGLEALIKRLRGSSGL